MSVIKFSTDKKVEDNLVVPTLSKEDIQKQKMLEAKNIGMKDIKKFENALTNIIDVCKDSCVFANFEEEFKQYQIIIELMTNVVKGIKPAGSDVEMYTKYRKQIFEKIAKKMIEEEEKCKK